VGQPADEDGLGDEEGAEHDDADVVDETTSSTTG
jgi:hypothetical protein